MLNLQRIIALVANLGQATSRRDNNSRANSSTEDATAQEEGKEDAGATGETGGGTREGEEEDIGAIGVLEGHPLTGNILSPGA